MIKKLITVGLISGLVSGFFGAGGGVVLIFALTLLLKNEGKKIFAQTALITAAFSVVSAVIYALKGNLPFALSLKYLLPALIGGALGAFLLGRVKIKAVRRIFAFTVIAAGIIMIFR